MRWLAKLRLRSKTILRRNTVERELDSELRFHLEQQIAENIASGMSPENAHVAALRSIGGLAQIAEECRDARGVALLETFAQDVRYGLRQLRRAPAFTSVAVLTLALGIGANTAIFTVIDALMFKTLPVKEPQRLVILDRGSTGDEPFSYPMFRQIQQQGDVFSSVFTNSLSGMYLGQGGSRQLVVGLLVSGNCFSTLGVSAALGRTITDRDDQRGAADVVVLSYQFWQRKFGGDPKILGRTISLDKKPFQIIGVTAKGFFGTYIGSEFDFALPVHALEILEPPSPGEEDPFEDPQNYQIGILAQLTPGVTLEQARARLRALAPVINLAGLPPKIEPRYRDQFLKTPIDVVSAAAGDSNVRDYYGYSLFVLAGIVGLVLLIACANVANLLLARASARAHEYAVRAALGARRSRVLRQVLTESLMLSAGGVLAGFLVARLGSAWLVRATGSSQAPVFLDLSPDFRVAAFMVATMLATAILFGSAPALRLSNVAPYGALKEGTRGIMGGAQNKAARLIMGAQVALCVVLLFGAELLVGSVRDLLRQDPGFHTDGVLLVGTDIDRRETPQVDLLALELQRRLQSLPGVRSVSRSLITPIMGAWVQLEVQPIAAGVAQPVQVYANVVSPRYFSTLEIPLIEGRDFDDRDTAASPHVAILDESATSKLFPNQNPIGQTYRTRDFTRERREITVTVVGLVKNAKYRQLRDAPPPTIYFPISQSPIPLLGTGRYEVRFSGPVSAITKRIEEAVQSLDPTISLDLLLFSSQLRESLHRQRLMANLFSLFSTLALLLVATGIYGVMAYVVARRTNEIGVRIALGARRGDVISMVLREALVVVAVGTAVGIPSAMAASRLIKSFLFQISPIDPGIIALAICIIVVIALAAAYIPARRASGIDPMVALRYE